MKSWIRKSRKTLLKDRWLTLHADECELPTGQIVSPYYVIEERNWVHVTAVNSEGQILLTRQYRYAANLITSELPCGIIESGESPLDAARRELREETGHIANDWTEVGVLFNNRGKNPNHFVIASESAFIRVDLWLKSPSFPIASALIRVNSRDSRFPSLRVSAPSY